MPAIRRESSKPRPVAARPRARGEVTRQKLIAIAERRFAEYGIEGVSLSDINQAAGQRNKNATHYHFGSKQGLMQAILDKHEPALAARHAELIAQIEASGAVTARNIVRVLVEPLAEKLQDRTHGGRDYIRFNAQLVMTHVLATLKLRRSPLKIRVERRLQTLLESLAPDQPADVAHQRGILVAVLVMQGLAGWAQMLDSGGRRPHAGSTELFVANLVDSITAMLSLPPSEETLALAIRASRY